MNMEKKYELAGAIALNVLIVFALIAIIASNVNTYLLTQEARASVQAREIANRSLAKYNLEELIRCHSVGGMVRATDEGAIECSDSIGITNFKVIAEPE